MKTRRVLLDGSFIGAVLDDEHPSHRAAVTAYASLIDGYQAGSDRLFALSTVLDAYQREGGLDALAPIETTWVARQHRGAVRKVCASSPEVAMSLLMLRRERFHAIATALHDFDQFEIEVLSVAPDTLDRAPAAGQIPDGYVSYGNGNVNGNVNVNYETAPMPARQSTDG